MEFNMLRTIGLKNILKTHSPKLNLLLINNKTWYKHKGWKEKEFAQEHDDSKHGLLSLKTPCEVKKCNVVELIMVETYICPTQETKC